MARSRAFVCDPRCVEAIGADIDSLKYFTKYITPYFEEVVPVCCRYLDEEIAEKAGFVRLFDFYYDEYRPIPRPPGEIAPVMRTPSRGHIDAIEEAATADAKRFLDQFEIGPDDALLFPSADFYGVVGLLNALFETAAERRPRVLLRFIGVSETGSYVYRDALGELTGRLTEAIAAGIRIDVSAETPKYADRLAAMMNLRVGVTPFLDVAPPQSMPEFGPFVYFCPGSARVDKGFLQLGDLFREVRCADPEFSIRFVIQDIPPRDGRELQNAISQLYAIPGLELLPAWISEEEILDNYRRCHAVLLPYDQPTYAYRGSAAMMIAACFGRPCVTLDGTAFAEQVRFYNLGQTVPHVGDMASEMIALARRPRRWLTSRALQGRHRFLLDAANGFDKWVRQSI